MSIVAAVGSTISIQAPTAALPPKPPANDRDHDGDNNAAVVRPALPSSQGKTLDVDA